MRTLLGIVLSVCISSSMSHASTWTVSSSGNGQYTSIQEAINNASDFDVITIQGGTYLESNIDTNGLSVILIGETNEDGTPAVIVDAQGIASASVFYIHKNETPLTMLQNLVIQNAPLSGVVIIDSSPTFSNCHIKNNASVSGGGVNIGSTSVPHLARPVFSNCLITQNYASVSGGGVTSNDSLPTFSDCEISHNTVSPVNGLGGGLFCGAQFDFTHQSALIFNSLITENSAWEGAGVYLKNGLWVRDARIVYNNARKATGGGGIFAEVSVFQLVLEGKTFVCGNTPNQITGIDCHATQDADELYEGPHCEGACCLSTGCAEIYKAQCHEINGTYHEDLLCTEICPSALASDSCVSDLNGDGEVNTDDVNLLLSVWGVCP